MITLNIILDTRRPNQDGLYPIKLRITSNRTTSNISTGCYTSERAFIGSIEQSIVKTFPQAAIINRKIRAQYLEYYDLIDQIEREGKYRNANATRIKERIDELLNAEAFADASFTDEIEKYTENCRAEKTAIGYKYANTLLHEFMRKKKIYFEDITFAVLTNFDRWMEKRGMATNSRSIIFRNIRTVFNHAIKLDIIQSNIYPFRRFEIKRAQVNKDYLTISELQELLSLDLKGQEHQARDFFLLSFYLCGINPIDLYNLNKPDGKNKVSFIRKKIVPKSPPTTHLYIPEQAMEIIERYKGATHLLNFVEKHVYSTFIRRIDRNLKVIGNKIGRHLYLYLARDTWATIASQIGIPLEIISKALGHTDNSTAERYYISFDWTKVKEANEKVIASIH